MQKQIEKLTHDQLKELILELETAIAQEIKVPRAKQARIDSIMKVLGASGDAAVQVVQDFFKDLKAKQDAQVASDDAESPEWEDEPVVVPESPKEIQKKKDDEAKAALQAQRDKKLEVEAKRKAKALADAFPECDDRLEVFIVRATPHGRLAMRGVKRGDAVVNPTMEIKKLIKRMPYSLVSVAQARELIVSGDASFSVVSSNI